MIDRSISSPFFKINYSNPRCNNLGGKTHNEPQLAIVKFIQAYNNQLQLLLKKLN
jgi:hypothetical protein